MSIHTDSVIQVSDHFSLDNSSKPCCTSDVMSKNAVSRKISEIANQELHSVFSTLPSGPTSISCGEDEDGRNIEHPFPYASSPSHSINAKNAISDNTFIDQTEAFEDEPILLADKTQSNDSLKKEERLFVTFLTTSERKMERNQPGDVCVVSENPGLAYQNQTSCSGHENSLSKSKRRKGDGFGMDGCAVRKISKQKKGLNAEEHDMLPATKNSRKGARKKRKPSKEHSLRKSQRERGVKSDTYTIDAKELDNEIRNNKPTRSSNKRTVKSANQQSGQESVEKGGGRQEDLKFGDKPGAFKEGQNLCYVCCICSQKFPYCTSIKKHIFLDHSKTFCALAQTETQDSCVLPMLLLFCPNKCFYVTSKSDDFFQHIVSCKKPEINCEKDFTDTQENFITDDCEEEHEDDIHSQQVDQTSQQTVEQTGHSDIKVEETMNGGKMCQHCSLTFSTTILLESHLQKEHHEVYGEMTPEKRLMLSLHKEQKIGTVINKAIGRKAHRCLQCGESFPCNTHLQIHIRSHTGKKLFECEDCDKSFIKKSDLVRHVRRHTGEKPFNCSDCGRGFASKSDVQRHMKTHRKEPGRVKKCKDNNRFHKLIIRHMGQKPCKCELCGKNLQNERNLPRHMKTHTGERPFPCCHCDATFTDNSQLLRHVRTHTGEKPFPCNVCGKRFTQKSQLGRHIRIHTGERPYQCSECGKNFRDGSQLLVHMRRHTGVRPHQCALCGRNFFRSSELQQHQRMHTGEKPFQCHECGKSFSLKDVLQAHMRVHTGEKPFKCKECGKYFRDNRNLYKHTRTHTGEKPFQCNECGKRFGQSNQLTRHMRTHTGERPYKCTECGKNFRDTCTRIAHMRIHTGEKPYRCNECGKSFGYSSHLNRHLKIHQREKKFIV